MKGDGVWVSDSGEKIMKENIRKTKIVGTIGPATDDEETFTKLVEAGLNVARINFSHGGYEENKEKIEMIKKVRAKLNKPVAILLDTKGPEIRTGILETGDEKVTINEGQTFTFLNEDVIGNNEKTSVSYKELYKDVTVGSRLLVDDGALEFQIMAIEGKDIVCKALNTGELGSRKTMNVPGMKLELPALTDKDVEDITKGKTIVGTGTIDKNGNVGAIGGVEYKIKGAVKSKADLFIVPNENLDEALKVKKKYNYKIKIVGVDTFDEALNYLKNN